MKKTISKKSVYFKRTFFLVSFFVLSNLLATAQNLNISGTVLDSKNEPVAGATVMVKGTTTGVTTGVNGNYDIAAPPDATLVFSLVGMGTHEESINGRGRIDIVMADAELEIDDVVVIGYGVAKKRDLTGSIVSVSGETVADKPSANPLASIQGKVAGVQVINTGRAGQDPEIRVRGINSINGYAPLYVVDGLFTDNINFLNPNDIEQMEILKDASSLAIFGVRGANGVVIITTKKAKQGQTVVNINSTIGWKNITERLPMTNAAQFRELYDEQRVNQGLAPFDYTNWQANTNWQDEIFQVGFLNINNASITGSTEKSKFYAGLGYTTEEGSIKSEEFSKITLNLNSEYKVSNYFKVGFQVNGSRTVTPDAKNVDGVLKAAPIAPTHYDYIDPTTGETERLLHTMPDFQRGQASNPLREIEWRGNHNLANNQRMAGNIFGEISFLKHFTFKATYSVDYRVDEARSFSPINYEYNPDVAEKKVESGLREEVKQSKITEGAFQQDYILTYDNTFGAHGITAMLGATSNYKEYSKLEGIRFQNRDDIYFSPGNNTDKWWLSSLSKDGPQTNDGSQWRRFTMSYLARALYNYNSRYLLNASFRRDGSSVFSGVGNTWDNFYSFGGGWVASEEAFMQNQNVVNYLKIKGSWGVLGSENTGTNNYPSYPTLSSVGSAVFGDEVVPGYAAQIMVQDLHWEKTYSWEAGFEMRLLKQRLTIEPVYYTKTTKDIIVSLASRTGATNSLENMGEIRNSGFELAAQWRDNVGSNFHYAVGANFTTINNKVLSLGRDEGDAKFENNSRSRTMAGYPIAHFYGYEVEGVYQTWNDIKQSPKNTVYKVLPGDLKFKDADGDGKITAEDRTVIGNPTPDCIYGFNFNVGYKGIELSAEFMGQYGNEIYRNWGTSTYAQLNYQEHNLDRWNGKGTSNWEPILDPARAVNNVASSYFVEDGSFFRIRNIQLSYTFPKTLLSKVYVQQLRIYANVQNLKTWHKNSGFTPEVGGGALTFGMDGGGYPMPTVYTLGINLSF